MGQISYPSPPEPPPVVVVRPSRHAIETAVANLHVYGMLRQALGRAQAFRQWCEVMELSGPEALSLTRIRIDLLQQIGLGHLSYDDIDWSGRDVDRRASSTGTVFVDTLEAWLET